MKMFSYRCTLIYFTLFQLFNYTVILGRALHLLRRVVLWLKFQITLQQFYLKARHVLYYLFM
jgi:hypothetical protein